MASSLVFSSFSLQRRNQNPLSPVNQSPSSSTNFSFSSNHSLLQTLQCRKSFNLTPNYQTQTRTRNPPPPAPERSKFIYQFERTGEFTSIDDFNDALISLLVDNEPESTLKLFGDLAEYRLTPDGWTYSIVIKCRCKRNDPFEAKKALDVMVGSGFNPLSRLLL